MLYKRKAVVTIVICLLVAIMTVFLMPVFANIALHLNPDFNHSFFNRFIHYKWEIGESASKDIIAELYFRNDICYLDISGSGNMMQLSDGKGNFEGWYGDLMNMTTGWSISVNHINIGEGVCSISSNAFTNFGKLSYAVLPSSISKVESRAFSGCSSLKELLFNGSMEQWEQIELGSEWVKNSAISKVICSDGEIFL